MEPRELTTDDKTMKEKRIKMAEMETEVLLYLEKEKRLIKQNSSDRRMSESMLHENYIGIDSINKESQQGMFKI